MKTSQKICRFLGEIIAKPLNHVNTLTTEIVQAINPIRIMKIGDKSFKVYVNHGRVKWRTEVIEEPMTIGWIQSMTPNDIFWDVGANIGIYSLLASQYCKLVFSFEPESQNFALLVRNIAINKFENITPCNIPLNNNPNFSYLDVPELTQSGAYNRISTLRKGIINQICRCESIDSIVRAGFLCPTHLKIDVDGNELLILQGAKESLKDIREALIEIDLNDLNNRKIEKIMIDNGFKICGIDQNCNHRENSPKHSENVFNYLFKKMNKISEISKVSIEVKKKNPDKLNLYDEMGSAIHESASGVEKSLDSLAYVISRTIPERYKGERKGLGGDWH